MKFNEFKYERINIDETCVKFSELLDKLEKQENANDFIVILKEIFKLEEHIQTMQTLASVRHSINTKDEFYSKENDFWDQNSPILSEYYTKENQIILNFKDREGLLKFIPDVIFKLLECQVKTFKPEIIELLQKENELTSAYGKLKAEAQIVIDDVTYNLSTITKLCDSSDEETRKKGYDGKYQFYLEHEEEFDDIYDKLVKIRNEIALKLGFKNFVELGYNRMMRVDYDASMVANYRKQIIEEIVPINNILYAKQAKRIGKEKLAYYNEKFEFLSGNPKPYGTKDELVSKAHKMYHELSKETGEFIDVMINQDLFDLDSKDGKQMGGYCTSIEEYKVPFIFANFNGSSHDVDVLTHEAGHAFQYYCSKEIEVPAAKWPTMESCEIHSMSMEFFAHPWMEEFFKQDYQKYYYYHVASALKFLPYGALVDHFQHVVYENPHFTSQERKQAWNDLSKLYLPHLENEGNTFLDKGCFFFQQGHIFEAPFYYIDYCLAQICALQFFKRIEEKDQNAFKDYLHLCSLGGTLSFTNLVKEANLKSPFKDGTVGSISSFVKDYLLNIDDSKF